jgi:hypothetical protein
LALHVEFKAFGFLVEIKKDARGNPVACPEEAVGLKDLVLSVEPLGTGRIPGSNPPQSIRLNSFGAWRIMAGVYAKSAK